MTHSFNANDRVEELKVTNITTGEAVEFKSLLDDTHVGLNVVDFINSNIDDRSGITYETIATLLTDITNVFWSFCESDDETEEDKMYFMGKHGNSIIKVVLQCNSIHERFNAINSASDDELIAELILRGYSVQKRSEFK